MYAGMTVRVGVIWEWRAEGRERCCRTEVIDRITDVCPLVRETKFCIRGNWW